MAEAGEAALCWLPPPLWAALIRVPNWCRGRSTLCDLDRASQARGSASVRPSPDLVQAPAKKALGGAFGAKKCQKCAVFDNFDAVTACAFEKTYLLSHHQFGRHAQQSHTGAQGRSPVPCFVAVRLRAQTPSGGSGPRRAAALRTLPREELRVRAGGGKTRRPQGLRPFWRSGLRPPLVRGRCPRNAPVQNQTPRVRTLCLVRSCALIQRYILPGQKRPSEEPPCQLRQSGRSRSRTPAANVSRYSTLAAGGSSLASQLLSPRPLQPPCRRAAIRSSKPTSAAAARCTYVHLSICAARRASPPRQHARTHSGPGRACQLDAASPTFDAFDALRRPPLSAQPACRLRQPQPDRRSVALPAAELAWRAGQSRCRHASAPGRARQQARRAADRSSMPTSAAAARCTYVHLSICADRRASTHASRHAGPGRA